MATLSRFTAKNGLDNNNKTIINLLDPVNATDAVTKQFAINASNLASGTVPASVLSSANLITALGYTPINKAGDTGIGSLSMSALTATTGNFSSTVTATQFNGSGAGISLLTLPIGSINATGTASNTTYLRGDGSWAPALATGIATTDDTSTNATYYPVIETSTSSGIFKTSSTKLSFNPSTGSLSLPSNGDTLTLGTGTITYPTTPSTGSGNIVLKGGNGDFRLAVQDGTARGNIYWNAYYDSTAVQHKYQNTGDAALDLKFDGSAGNITFNMASSGTAGNAITWNPVLNLSTSGTATFSGGIQTGPYTSGFIGQSSNSNIAIRIQAGVGDTSGVLQFTNNANTVEWGRITSTNNLLTSTVPFSAINFKSTASFLGNSSLIYSYIGTTDDNVTDSVILLHPAYNGTLIARYGFNGVISFNRGGTGAFNISDIYEIYSSTAYNNNVAALRSITSAISNAYMCTCTYSGTLYVALYVPKTSAREVYFRSNNMSSTAPTLVLASSVTGVTKLSGTTHTFTNPVTSNSGITGAQFPTLGSPTNASFIAYNADPNYGVMIGVDGSGTGWIQVSRTDANPTSYPLILQPSGNSVSVPGPVSFSTADRGFSIGPVVGAARMYYGDTAATYSFIKSDADGGGLANLYAGAGTFNGTLSATCGYTTYTADGLFGTSITPSTIITPFNNKLLFGYSDGGNGQYVPRIGFLANYAASPGNQVGTKASIGLEPVSGDFTIRGGANNTEQFRLYNSNNVAAFSGNLTAPNVVYGNGTGTLGTKTTNISGASNQGLSSGFYDGSSLTDMPTTDWYHLLVNTHTNSSTSNLYELQIAAPFWGRNHLYFRTLDPSNPPTTTSGGWNEIYHSGNISTAYAGGVVTSTNASSSYLSIPFLSGTSGNVSVYNAAASLAFQPSTGNFTVNGKINCVSLYATGPVVANSIMSYSPANGATVTVDCSVGNTFIINLPTSGTAVTFGTPANVINGQVINIIIIQGSSVATTITWPANTVMKWASGTKNISTSLNSINMISMVYTGSYWLVTSAKDFA